MLVNRIKMYQQKLEIIYIFLNVQKNWEMLGKVMSFV